MTTTTDNSTTAVAFIGNQLRKLGQFQTYKNLLYLVLAFPLGLAYWVFLVIGFTIGTVFSILLVGILILLLTVFLGRLFARFERWLTVRLLDVELPEPPSVEPAEGMLGGLRAYLDDPFTWRGLGFVSLKFWVGILGIILAYGLFTAGSMVLSPVRRPYELELFEVSGEPVVWTIDSMVDVALAVPGGILLGIVVLVISNGFANVMVGMARSLLGSDG